MTEHRCYRNGDCRQWEKVEGERVGRQIEAEIGFCEACRSSLVDALGNLIHDYADLTDHIGDPVSGEGAHVTYTRDLKVPITLSVDALRTDILFTASTWAEIVARVRGIDGPGHWTQRHIRPAVMLESSVKMLESSVSVLLSVWDEEVAVWTPEESSDLNVRSIRGTSEMQPPPQFDFGYTRDGQWDYIEMHGLDGAVRLIELHHQTRRLLGLTKARHRHRLPCPRCEGQLTSAYGSDLIECGSCSFKRSRNDYEKLCLILAERKGA